MVKRFFALRPLTVRYAQEIDDYITTLEIERGKEFWRNMEPGELLGLLICQVAQLAESMARDCCGQQEALGFVGAVAAMMDEEKMAFIDEAEAQGLVRRAGEAKPDA